MNYADMLDIQSGGLHVDVSGGGMTVVEGIDISQDPVNPGDGLSVTLGGLRPRGHDYHRRGDNRLRRSHFFYRRGSVLGGLG